jgi:hypothetical protein
VGSGNQRERERSTGWAERGKKERGKEWACTGKMLAQGERGGGLGCLADCLL